LHCARYLPSGVILITVNGLLQTSGLTLQVINLNLGAAGDTQRGQFLVQVNLGQPVFFPII
jgi:hypothetical protein